MPVQAKRLVIAPPPKGSAIPNHANLVETRWGYPLRAIFEAVTIPRASNPIPPTSCLRCKGLFAVRPAALRPLPGVARRPSSLRLHPVAGVPPHPLTLSPRVPFRSSRCAAIIELLIASPIRASKNTKIAAATMPWLRRVNLRARSIQFGGLALIV